VAEQARDAVVRANRLQDLLGSWHERLAKARSALPLRLADRLFDSQVLTIPQAQRHLGVTYHSAQKIVQKLVAEGILP
jgi:Fic family protein